MEEETSTEAKEVAVPAQPARPTLKQLYDMRKQAQAAPQVLFQKCSAAFHAGEKAKRMGWERVPVSYEQYSVLPNQFFYDGYDGKSWKEAVHRLIGTPNKPEAQPA